MAPDRQQSPCFGRHNGEPTDAVDHKSRSYSQLNILLSIVGRARAHICVETHLSPDFIGTSKKGRSQESQETDRRIGAFAGCEDLGCWGLVQASAHNSEAEPDCQCDRGTQVFGRYGRRPACESDKPRKTSDQFDEKPYDSNCPLFNTCVWAPESPGCLKQSGRLNCLRGLE